MLSGSADTPGPEDVGETREATVNVGWGCRQHPIQQAGHGTMWLVRFVSREAVLSDAGWDGLLEILIDAAVGGWLVGVLGLWHGDRGKAAVKRGTLPRGRTFNCRLTEATMPRAGMVSTVQPCKTFAKIEKR